MPRHGGYRAGAGRPKGVPNKLTTDLKTMILGALEDAGGRDYLTQQAAQNPAAFLTLVGKILPLQMVGDRDNPVQFVVRGPSAVESASDWLKAHAPQIIDGEVESETIP